MGNTCELKTKQRALASVRGKTIAADPIGDSTKSLGRSPANRRPIGVVAIALRGGRSARAANDSRGSPRLRRQQAESRASPRPEPAGSVQKAEKTRRDRLVRWRCSSIHLNLGSHSTEFRRDHYERTCSQITRCLQNRLEIVLASAQARRRVSAKA